MKKQIKYLSALLIVFAFPNSFYGQETRDSLSTEKMIGHLYLVYFHETFYNDTFDPCLLEKAESLCFKLLEKDSLNLTANNFLSLIYYNEIARMDTVSSDNAEIKELRVKTKYYRDRASRILDAKEGEKFLEEEKRENYIINDSIK